MGTWRRFKPINNPIYIKVDEYNWEVYEFVNYRRYCPSFPHMAEYVENFPYRQNWNRRLDRGTARNLETRYANNGDCQPHPDMPGFDGWLYELKDREGNSRFFKSGSIVEKKQFEEFLSQNKTTLDYYRTIVEDLELKLAGLEAVQKKQRGEI